ncbi:MAG: leishmanolysin-related zinc metalloendopeptidase, partial [Actinomycetes bacterium]
MTSPAAPSRRRAWPRGLVALVLLAAGAVAGPVSDAEPAAAVTPGSLYVPLTPCRVLDTRSGGGALQPNVARNVQVAGTGAAIAAQGGTPGGCGVPSTATAVEMAVSAVNPVGNGFLRIWPAGETAPTATFVNYAAGQSTTNTGAVTRAATSPDLTLQAFVAATEVVVDVQGYYTESGAGSGYTALAPCRLLDTRSAGGPVIPGTTRPFWFAGTGGQLAAQGGNGAGCGVPATATAVQVSVSAVGPAGTGFLRVWPSNAAAPTATFVNYTGGQSTTNAGAVTLGATGPELNLRGFVTATEVVVDVQGYYTASSGARYVPLTPCRVVDTRATSPLGADATRTFQTATPASAVAAQGGNATGCGVPDNAVAVEAAVSAVNPVGAGFLRAWPGGQAAPTATFVNFTGGQSTTNTGAVTRSSSTCGTNDLSLGAFVATTQVVVDVQGYFTNGGTTAPTVCSFTRATAPSPAPANPPAPALVGLSWSVDDADGNALSCQLDKDGNGVFETSVPSCTSGADFVTFPTSGTRTPVLKVTDGAQTTTQNAPSVTVAAAPSDPTYDIVLNNVGPAVTPAVQAAFDAAAARWESIIVKGVPDVTTSGVAAGGCDLPEEPGVPAGTVWDDLVIDFVVKPIDGNFNVLGFAGPCRLGQDFLPRFGVMAFDSADLERLQTEGRLTDVIVHEMGHVLGIGTVWDVGRSLVAGAGTLQSAYTGPLGRTAYAVLGGSGNVPLETDGVPGDGTVDSHWKEKWTAQDGRQCFGGELMTGRLNSVNQLSVLSIASVADLGDQVD